MDHAQAYELYVLSQMQSQSKVSQALASLGVGRNIMRETAEHVGNVLGFNAVGQGITKYFQVLGEPTETTPEPGLDSQSGFWGSLRHRFHLSLWPDFDFIVRSHPAGWAWKPELIRRSDWKAGVLPALEALEPWAHLRSEVLAGFGPFTSEYAFNLSIEGIYVVQRAVAPVELSLLFDFELFQGVRE